MIKFTYVEEYLEAIAGYRDPITGKPKANWFYSFEPIINLARYDVKVLDSMSQSVVSNQALTERQGELLVKIVLKYERQLANKLIDVSPVEQPQWRVALRKMDYSRSLTIENDQLVVRFPFSNELIDSIRTFGKESQGAVYWDRDRKVWLAALTEYNLSWLDAWAELHKFEVDPAVRLLMDKIKDTEAAEYRIELYMDGDQLNISNCPDSLREYINTIGGFGLDNILNLVDMSGILGYTVESAIYEAIVAEYGHRFYTLAINREIKINPNTLMSDSDFDAVLDYADQLERWPVVIYEPDLSKRMLTKLKDRYGEDYDQERYQHCVKPIKTLDHIPLVISSAGMVFGGAKHIMLQRAEKVVYCAADVYNNRSNTKVKSIAS